MQSNQMGQGQGQGGQGVGAGQQQPMAAAQLQHLQQMQARLRQQQQQAAAGGNGAVAQQLGLGLGLVGVGAGSFAGLAGLQQQRVAAAAAAAQQYGANAQWGGGMQQQQPHAQAQAATVQNHAAQLQQQMNQQQSPFALPQSAAAVGGIAGMIAAGGNGIAGMNATNAAFLMQQQQFQQQQAQLQLQAQQQKRQSIVGGAAAVAAVADDVGSANDQQRQGGGGGLQIPQQQAQQQPQAAQAALYWNALQASNNSNGGGGGGSVSSGGDSSRQSGGGGASAAQLQQILQGQQIKQLGGGGGSVSIAAAQQAQIQQQMLAQIQQQGGGGQQQQQHAQGQGQGGMYQQSDGGGQGKDHGAQGQGQSQQPQGQGQGGGGSSQLLLQQQSLIAQLQRQIQQRQKQQGGGSGQQQQPQQRQGSSALSSQIPGSQQQEKELQNDMRPSTSNNSLATGMLQQQQQQQRQQNQGPANADDISDQISLQSQQPQQQLQPTTLSRQSSSSGQQPHKSQQQLGIGDVDSAAALQMKQQRLANGMPQQQQQSLKQQQYPMAAQTQQGYSGGGGGVAGNLAMHMAQLQQQQQILMAQMAASQQSGDSSGQNQAVFAQQMKQLQMIQLQQQQWQQAASKLKEQQGQDQGQGQGQSIDQDQGGKMQAIRDDSSQPSGTGKSRRKKSNSKRNRKKKGESSIGQAKSDGEGGGSTAGTASMASSTGQRAEIGEQITQQTFLDGTFAGGWQSNADLPDRRRIIFSIVKVIERMRPDANKMSQKLPFMAKKLEEHLYRSAVTKEEYVDQSTLKKRLQMIAHGLGVPNKDGNKEQAIEQPQQHQQEPQHMQPQQQQQTQNDQVAQATNMGIRLEAQVDASSNSNGGASDGAQSAQAQHQLNVLKEQQQRQQLELLAAAMQQQQGQDGSQGVTLSKEALLQQLQLQQANGQDAGSSMMENLNQLLMKQRQQQEEVKQHEQLKQKQAQQLAAQQAGLSGSMTPLALQQMLNQKSKPSHPAIEQLQKNLRQASHSQLHQQNEEHDQQHAELVPQHPPPPSESPSIPSIDANMSLNDRGDLSSGSVLGGTDELAKAQKKKVIRQQQKRLVLLRHASKCKSGPSCKTKFCPQMVVLWKHMKKCRDKNCKVAHCLSSRCVLNHYRICKGENRTSSCEVCAPVMRYIRSQAIADGEDGDQMEELAEEARTVSSQDLNMSGMQSPAFGNVAGDAPLQQQLQQQQQSQLSDQQGQQDGDQAMSASEAQHMAELQAAQQKLQQQQLLLQQLQQQQAQLLEQQKQLQQQQQQVLPQTQQGQQLQQQQTLLQKLQQEFQQQQQLLQHELQRQSLILQQGQRVQMERQTSVSGTNTPIMPLDSSQYASLDGNKRKRMGDEGGKRLSKMAREMSAAAMRQKRSAAAMADGQPPSQRYRMERDEEPEDGKTTEGTIDTVTSLIPSMTTASIIEHLDSLHGGLCLTPRRVGQRCLPVIRKLINDPCGWVFRDPVNPVELGLPDYFDVVKKPMHLALIEQKLESGVYMDMDEFKKEVRLVFDNAILYNGENSDVGEMASDMLKSFEREYAILQKALKTEEQIQKRKGDSCALCGSQRRLFEPTVLYCNGACGMQRIRRNASYYTDPSKQNHWCTSCYVLLKDGEPVALDDGSEISKSSLQKFKNDALPEEAWVQCDDCHEWVHQICALFNGRRNKTAVAYTCPSCYVKKKSGEGEKNEEMQVVKCAKDLPQCTMSNAIETGVEKALAKKYEEKAKELKVNVDQIDKADGISIRVVSNMERQHHVRDEMLKRYEKKGCPSQYPVRTKCILLFQKIHGVDVLLFGLYVYEYGQDCPAPNRRRVYISYLDSVQYFEPACYRTTVYHSILVEYLRFVKKRGFHTAHIWSCPPSKGDDYIFYCHPSQQLTPKDDMLCQWYHDMLRKAEEEGIVMSTQLLYDVYFANKGQDAVSGQAVDPTCIPYFEGDYISGELENIIKDVTADEEAKKKERDAVSIPGSSSKVAGRKRGTRSNPGELVNQNQDKIMLRLGQALTNMKQNFIIANLLSRDFAAAVERGEDVSNWVVDEEDGAKKKKVGGKDPSILYADDNDDESSCEKKDQTDLSKAEEAKSTSEEATREGGRKNGGDETTSVASSKCHEDPRPAVEKSEVSDEKAETEKDVSPESKAQDGNDNKSAKESSLKEQPSELSPETAADEKQVDEGDDGKGTETADQVEVADKELPNTDSSMNAESGGKANECPAEGVKVDVDGSDDVGAKTASTPKDEEEVGNQDEGRHDAKDPLKSVDAEGCTASKESDKQPKASSELKDGEAVSSEVEELSTSGEAGTPKDAASDTEMKINESTCSSKVNDNVDTSTDEAAAIDSTKISEGERSGNTVRVQTDEDAGEKEPTSEGEVGTPGDDDTPGKDSTPGEDGTPDDAVPSKVDKEGKETSSPGDDATEEISSPEARTEETGTKEGEEPQLAENEDDAKERDDGRNNPNSEAPEADTEVRTEAYKTGEDTAAGAAEVATSKENEDAAQREGEMSTPDEVSGDSSREDDAPKAIGNTVDKDALQESEVLDSRQQFLNYCQTNHFQFDELRRAKHSTMMILFHLHNPNAPKFVQQCGACYREITCGTKFHCNQCSNFDLCGDCYRPVTTGLWAQRDARFSHDRSHTFRPFNMDKEKRAGSQRSREERARAIKMHLELLAHAATCPGAPVCTLNNCSRMKKLFEHVRSCDVTYKRGCKVCARLLALLSMHARMCNTRGSCAIPFCDRIRERNRRLRKQQQLMDDRRRVAQNELYRRRAAGGS